MLNKFKELIQSNEELLKHPFVQGLILIIEQQAKEIEELKAEIRMLKEHPSKPNIKPSNLEKPQEPPSDDANESNGVHKGKRAKKPNLPIDRTEKIKARDVPEGSVFKGYKKIIIQDIIIKRENILYKLEMWRTPDGKYLYGKLPESLQGTDFGTTLKSFILHQHYQCHVTQPLLHEQLKGFGIDISTGEISRILTENKNEFHKENSEIVSMALREMPFIQTDDTGARHQGKNGYCTVVCNDFFSYFKSTESKSRINFIELLRGEYTDYHIDETAFEYMTAQGLPDKYMDCLLSSHVRLLPDKARWEAHLIKLNIRADHAIRIITEGALIGSMFAHGVNKNLSILSDDAGQFNILLHALCWIHTERNLQKLHYYTTEQETELQTILSRFWQLYQDLKEYRNNPTQEKAKQIESTFDAISHTSTQWLSLEQALQRLTSNKKELLLVLTRPEIPLHNNTSERDIREYVKRRKISGSTRSELGRQCRDTFTSLKKTCRKLQISFWEFLNDRISKTNEIENLAVLVKQNYYASLVPIACRGA